MIMNSMPLVFAIMLLSTRICAMFLLCEPGTFQSVNESCLPCPVGTFSWEEDTLLACTSCSPGSYQFEEGSTACTPCSPGSYQPDEGSSTPCPLCLPGFSQFEMGATACLECVPGTYAWSNGSHRCIECPEGRYQRDAGGIECDVCPQGTFTDFVGGVSLRDCLNCSAGHYAEAPGASACRTCPPGFFSVDEGQTDCAQCHPGSFQANVAATKCRLCTPGTFSSSPSAVFCSACGVGTYSTASAADTETACASCQAGRFSSSEGQSSPDACLPCPIGYVASEARDLCTPCPIDTVCPGVGSVVPIPCVDPRLTCNGTQHMLAVEGFVPLLLFEHCTGVMRCPIGTQCLALYQQPFRQTHFVVFLHGPFGANLSCAGAPLSIFLDYARVDWTQQHHDDDVGNRSNDVLVWLLPQICPAGTFLLDVLCTPCPHGTFSPVPGALGMRTGCLACPPGSYSVDDRGAARCTPCEAGEFQEGEASTWCKPCPIGTYQALQGAVECLPCMPGTFSFLPASDQCFPCPAGSAQDSSGANSCLPCNSTGYSSSGDARCLPCGYTPDLQQNQVCPLFSEVQLPVSRLDSFWITVRGATRDECLGRGGMVLSGRSLRLESLTSAAPTSGVGVSCVHTLNVMGRPELAVEWTTTTTYTSQARMPVGLTVVPFNSTFYPSLCQRDGLGVAYTVSDPAGGLWSDFSDVDEVILDFLSPLTDEVLFRAACESPSSPVPVGTCVSRSFCPNADVLARVTLTSQSGNFSVAGSALLRVGGASLCPISTVWMVRVDLVSPSTPLFPGDNATITVSSPFLPSPLESFRFNVVVMQDVALLSLQGSSSYSVRSSPGDGNVLSISGTGLHGDKKDEFLLQLTFQMGKRVTGLTSLLRFVPGSFVFDLRGGGYYVVPVRTQGFTCNEGGFVNAMLDYRRVTAIVSHPSTRTLVYWTALQQSAPGFPLSIATLGVWNCMGCTTLVSARCTSLTRKRISSSLSCDAVHPLEDSGGGIVRVELENTGVSTLVHVDVLAPVNSSVVYIEGLDGSSGRFKIMTRLVCGREPAFGGVLVDATPYLVPLGAQFSSSPSSGVRMQGEEWACEPGYLQPFSVGSPVLFHGHCNAQQDRLLHADELVSFLFTGGTGSADTFLFSRSVLHPSTPSASLLHLSPDSGLLFHNARPPFSSLTGNDWVNRVEVRAGRLVLLNRGFTPTCLDREVIMVIPAAPASLEVSLSHTALATQYDPWGALPTVSTVLEAWLHSSDGSVVDVRDDPRLFWTSLSPEDLDVLPGGGVQTRNTSGTFVVQYKMLGMPCLTASCSVTVFPLSVLKASIVCPSCPAILTHTDDPMSTHFPHLFPRSIPMAAFSVRFLLADGTVQDKQQKMAISGPVAWVDGHIVSLGDGYLAVSTYGVDEDYVILTTQRCLTDCDPLCNGVACDAALKLAPVGDGASMPPFSFETTLNISMKLLVVDGTVLLVRWLDDVRLEVNQVDVSPSYFESASTLAFGKIVLGFVFPAAYSTMRPVTGTRSLFVHRLESVEISGPTLLSQIHCSGMWEHGFYTVTARLSNGEFFDPREQAILVLDGDVLTTPGVGNVVHVAMAGYGWIQTSFRGVSSDRVIVEATSSSKLIETVDLRFLPVFWTATPHQSVSLLDAASLYPVFDIASSQRRRFLDKILTWTAEPRHVVSFNPADATMSLRSDYYCSTLVVSAVLSPCGVQQQPHPFSARVHVNLVPSMSGQIDLGEKTGLPLPRTPVGEVLTIPVFLFAEPPLPVVSSYDVSIALDEVTLSALDCDGGVLAGSLCTITGPGVMRATAQVQSEDAQEEDGGRILIALVQGIVRLDALSSIFITLHQATVNGRVLGPTVFRFSVRLGLADLNPHQPYANAVGPLRVPVFTSYPTPMTELRVCCHTSIARRGSRLARSFPVSFKLSKITGLLAESSEWVSLDLMDPRFRVQYDHTLLHMQQGGAWTLRDSAPDFASTRIEISFFLQDALLPLRAHVLLTVVSIAGLALSPSSSQLLRVHCSPTVFQSKRLVGSFVLHNDLGVVPFDSADVLFFRVDSPGVAIVQEAPGGVLVTGVSPGITQIALHVNGFTVTTDVLVRNSSIFLKTVRLASPVVFVDCLNAVVTPSLLGWLEDDSFLTSLAFLNPPLSISPGPLQDRGGLTLALLGNTLWHAPGTFSLVIPACQDHPPVTVASPLLTRVVACPDQQEGSFDVELTPLPDEGGFTVTLVGVGGVEAFFIHMQIDTLLLHCTAQTTQSDCVVNSPVLGQLIVAGAPQTTTFSDRLAVAVVGYSGPISNAWGFVEVCQRGTVHRSPIVAGRFGVVTPAQDPVKLLMPVLPVVDTGTLVRLSRSKGNMQAATFALQLMTNRQRLVEHVFYSNDGELSLMFHVRDRFLRPDDFVFVNLQLVCHSGALPPSLAGLGVRQAALVGAGWYAIQWEGSTPKAVVGVQFQVNTSSSTVASSDWNNNATETILVEVGQPLQACPRFATSSAFFLVSFRLNTVSQPSPRIAALVACKLNVTARRVSFSRHVNASSVWTTMSVSLESFIRVRRVRSTIIMESWFITLLHLQSPLSSTRSIAGNVSSQGFSSLLVQFETVSVVNDTQDPHTPCPPGFYFSGNGSYSPLPPHAEAGDDCYGMVCIDGYTLDHFASSCAPNEVSINVAWICVSTILLLSCLVSTVVCCISMARSRHNNTALPDPFVAHTSPLEDDKLFGSFDSSRSGSHWDDMGHVCLEDFSTIPIDAADYPCSPRAHTLFAA